MMLMVRYGGFSVIRRDVVDSLLNTRTDSLCTSKTFILRQQKHCKFLGVYTQIKT